MKRHLATLAIAVALTLVAGTAWAYWSAGSITGGGGAAAAAAVNQGATPTATAAGPTVTVTWAAGTLTDGQAVSGYLVKRYDAGTLAVQTILTACTGTVTATSCVEGNVPNGSWKYSVTPVFATSWQGPESAKSATVTVVTDVTPPSNAITLSSVSGGALLSGTTLYYRGVAAGSVRLTNAVTDAGSGPASSTTGALSGVSTGWAHTASAVSTPAGGPYVSNSFDWAAGTTSGPGEAVTGRDVAGNTAVTNLTFANDSTAPSVDTVSYPDGYSPGRSVSVSLTTGTDAGSGIATRRLQRAVATITGNGCGTFGAFADIGTDSPASPYVDSLLPNGCYLYRYVVSDRVGNQDVATSASIVKIGYAAAVNATTGLLSYWRLGEAATTLTVADSFTGTSNTALTSHSPEIGGAWTFRSGSNIEKISSQNRAFRSGAGFSLNSIAGPTSADYAVEADLFPQTLLTGDLVGVVARLDVSVPATPKYYAAIWSRSTNSWSIVKANGTTLTQQGSAVAQTLVPLQNYRVRLEVSGTATTTLKLYVQGVLTITSTDSSSPLTSAGAAGILDGNPAASVTKADLTGIHFQNFQVAPLTYPRAADSKGTNTGDYKNGVTLGVTGALANSSDTAAQFDGLNDYVQMTGTTGIPVAATNRSVEAWFKTSSAAARQVIFDYGSLAATQEFGLWVDAGGATMTAWGWGSGNDKVFTMPAAVDNGSWHQVVLTYNGTSLTLYIDGVALAAQAATKATVMDAYGFGIGAIINPGDPNSGGFFNGMLDEVSFYTTVLSQATVSDHYLLANAPPADTSGPTGGSVDASGLMGTGSRYAASTSLSLVLAQGTDPSGVATTGNQLLRATATLSNGACGTFGSYALITGGTDPATPKTDTVADQACYSYQYVVLDTLGNATTYTSPSIKVDLTAPAAPSLGFSGFTNTYWTGTGTTVFYRSAAASGSFTATGTATDTASGIASYTFPSLGTGWTSSPGALGVNVYSWSGAPAAPGTQQVTATNNAGGSSPNSPFTMIADDIAPASGTVTYPGGVTTGTTVSVSFTAGTDVDSGIGTRLLQRASAPLTGTTCGSFGSFATVTGGTNPTSPLVDTVTSGSCYKYQYVVADNVGNLATATSATIVRAVISYDGLIHASTGLLGHWRLGEAPAATVAVDDKGTNNGTYAGGPTLGVAGAIAGDTNTAAQYDGVNDDTVIARQIQGDFSIEFWFKSTQGIGTSPNWRLGAGLVDATSGVTLSPQDFGVSLRSDGVIVAGVGGSFLGAGDTSIRSSSGGYDNGAWHHVVFTRTQSSGAMVLYVDGGSAATGTGNTASLTGPTSIDFGRIQTGSNYYQGTLDEVAIYSSVLSGATVTSHYAAGTTAVDSAGPTGGSVDASGLVGTGGRYSTSTTLSLVLAKGTDPSGVATTGSQLLRASATLTNGSCGTFGGYTLVSGGTDPASPKGDTVTDQACYSYQYVVPDTLGNATTYTSPNIKVDTSAPAAPSLAFSAFTNSYWSGSGTTVFYRSAAASGSFVATGTASDASGIASYGYPGLGTNWTSTPGALGVNTYSWSGAPAAPGTKNVTATNNATGTSANSPFTLTPDDTAPTAGSVTYVDGDTAGTTVSVSFTQGTDAGSGIGTRLLQRASATRVDGACGTFGAFTTVTGGTNPTSPVVDSVTQGSCYKYQYVVADNVGNAQTASSASVAVSATGAFWAFNAGTGTSAVDSSGNANTGTLQAGAGWTTGRVGAGALSLTGATNSFVDVPTAVIDTSRSYSVALWVKPATLTGFQSFTSIDGTAISPFYLQMSSGVLQFTATGSDSSTAVGTTVTGGSATVGTWVHLVAVHDNVANTISFYVNGVLKGTTSFNSPWKATGHTLIGRAKFNGSPTDFVNGAIDEVHYYDRVLTATEITNLAAQ